MRVSAVFVSMCPMENIALKEDGSLKLYEVGYLLSPTIALESLSKECGKIKEALGADAFVASELEPKMKELAYHMEKESSGKKNIFENAYFGSIYFQAEPGSVDSIKKNFDKNENIIRYLVIKRNKEILMAPKKIYSPRVKPTHSMGTETKKIPSETVINEAELDKTIEELIA